MTHALINSNNWIDRFFDDFDRGVTASRAAFVPAIDIGEDKDAFLLRAELPGVARENIQVEVKDNRLMLSGRKDSVTKGEDHQVRYVESRHGEFSRVFELPRNVKSEAIEAEFKDGLLTLRIPKADEAKPKTVAIR
jgi:HSP20 family protein